MCIERRCVRRTSMRSERLLHHRPQPALHCLSLWLGLRRWRPPWWARRPMTDCAARSFKVSAPHCSDRTCGWARVLSYFKQIPFGARMACNIRHNYYVCLSIAHPPKLYLWGWRGVFWRQYSISLKACSGVRPHGLAANHFSNDTGVKYVYTPVKGGHSGMRDKTLPEREWEDTAKECFKPLSVYECV